MNVLQYDSEDSWLGALTTYWRDRLRCKPSTRHCLASGNTPIPVYREIVRAVQQGYASFQQARIFALDEFGGLASDDPGKCTNMLLRDLINSVDLPKENFYYFNADAADLEAECRAYDQAIGNGFDLVILGIGLNGHLGMNEPGSSMESPTRRVDLHKTTISSSARYLTHQQLPHWGLTVGMQQFAASKEVWLLATGKAKADIVRRTVTGPVSSDVPASLLRSHANCSLFVDAAAAALL
jgi:glucosamine-6-phosphate isomerase